MYKEHNSSGKGAAVAQCSIIFVPVFPQGNFYLGHLNSQVHLVIFTCIYLWDHV